MISEELVVDDPVGIFVPQRRHSDLACIVRITRAIGLMQIVEAVDAVGRAVGKRWIVFERPALLAQPRNRDRHTDRAGKLLQRQVYLRAMRPRAGVSNVEVIAPGFGLKTG